MAHSDRRFRLLHALRSLPPSVTAGTLAAETGVVPRSLNRDIAARAACTAQAKIVAIPPERVQRQAARAAQRMHRFDTPTPAPANQTAWPGCASSTSERARGGVGYHMVLAARAGHSAS